MEFALTKLNKNCCGSLDWTWSEDSTARESRGAQLSTAAMLAVEDEQGTRPVGRKDALR
jgi:hypothetical protein